MKKMLSIITVVLTCGLSIAQPRPAGNPPPPGNGQSPMAGVRPPAGNPGQAVRPTNTATAGRRMPGKVQHGRTSDREPSAADQKLLQAIMDADSLSELMRLSRKVQISRSVDVRQAMVDALDSQGKDAVNLLAAYIGDPDVDVANSAFTAWVAKLEDMKSARRIRSIIVAAQTLQQSGQFQAGEPVNGQPLLPAP